MLHKETDGPLLCPPCFPDHRNDRLGRGPATGPGTARLTNRAKVNRLKNSILIKLLLAIMVWAPTQVRPWSSALGGGGRIEQVGPQQGHEFAKRDLTSAFRLA
jgi:hypothetical protein